MVYGLLQEIQKYQFFFVYLLELFGYIRLLNFGNEENKMYEKHESQWTTFEKVLNWIGILSVLGIVFFGAIQVIFGYFIGERSIITMIAVSLFAIWFLCDAFDFYAKKYGYRKKK